jgi:hypothetical protein
MGSFFGSRNSSSTYDRPAKPAPSRVEVTVRHEHVTIPATTTTPNPNPLRFEIERCIQCGKALVIKVRYPDCTNYEGLKIMVYKDATMFELRDQKLGIDPHFSQSTRAKSPFARFEPTARGWKEAVKLAMSLRS